MNQRPPTGKGAPGQPRVQSNAPSDRSQSRTPADKRPHDSECPHVTMEQDAFADSDTLAEPDVSAEDRARIYALGYDAVVAALDAEDESTIAIVSECISACSEQVGALLKEGKDFLTALTPTAATPAVQAIAMEIVQEAVEEEMEGAE